MLDVYNVLINAVLKCYHEDSDVAFLHQVRAGLLHLFCTWAKFTSENMYEEESSQCLTPAGHQYSVETPRQLLLWHVSEMIQAQGRAESFFSLSINLQTIFLINHLVYNVPQNTDHNMLRWHIQIAHFVWATGQKPKRLSFSNGTKQREAEHTPD